MAVPDKYVAGSSTGTPFETGTTKSVVVTAESLSEVSGYEDDTITYTATVKDDSAASLPASFVVDLEIDSTKVVTAQALDAGVYDQGTGELNLEFTVPAAVGEFSVKLVWAEQLI